MNQATKNFVVLAVLCFTGIAPTPHFAQEWSSAQKEVWKNVEAYWELFAKGDLEGFMSYFHPDYRGWSYDSPVPGNKASVRKFLDHDLKTTKTLVYEINPLAIQIHGQIALVHYYYSEIVKDAEGKERPRSGRWTDVLMKQGDKWLLIGDHGGQTSKN